MDAHEALREKYGKTEIPTKEFLDKEIDDILYDSSKKVESDNPEERKIHEGMLIALVGENDFHTFQIQSITEPDSTT
jgi:hypothetical protein